MLEIARRTQNLYTKMYAVAFGVAYGTLIGLGLVEHNKDFLDLFLYMLISKELIFPITNFIYNSRHKD